MPQTVKHPFSRRRQHHRPAYRCCRVIRIPARVLVAADHDLRPLFRTKVAHCSQRHCVPDLAAFNGRYIQAPRVQLQRFHAPQALGTQHTRLTTNPAVSHSGQRCVNAPLTCWVAAAPPRGIRGGGGRRGATSPLPVTHVSARVGTTDTKMAVRQEGSSSLSLSLCKTQVHTPYDDTIRSGCSCTSRSCRL